MASGSNGADRLLEQEVSWGRRALPRAARAWWDASLSGQPRDYGRMEAADRAVNRHFARRQPYERLGRLLGQDELPSLTRRRLARTRLAYAGKQAPLDLLDRITGAEAAVQETYSTFRGELGGQRRSDNELEDVLRTAIDSATLRAAWEARKQIGSVVADNLRRLAELRNEAARANGFLNFWHQQLPAGGARPRPAPAHPGRS